MSKYSFFNDPFFRCRRRFAPRTKLEAAYFNWRQHEGHEQVTFLMHKDPLPKWFLEACKNYPLLDRTTLLLFGTVIFEHGIEEAMLELAFSEKEDVFISVLEEVALRQGYKLELTERNFLSHWVIANKKEAQTKYGDKWDTF